MSELPGGFPLSLAQIKEDLNSLEEAGTDTSVLSSLVPASLSSTKSSNDENLSDMITRLSKLSPQELNDEFSRITASENHSEVQLHEAVYNSSLLLVKISDWMDKTRVDFEEMMNTIQTIQSAHDSAIQIATSNPESS